MDRTLKVVFVGRSVDHFTYYETIVRRLLARGHEVTMLYDQEWSRDKRDGALQAALAEQPGLSLAWSLRRDDRWRRIAFEARELRTFSSYIDRFRRGRQSAFYLRRWSAYVRPEWRLDSGVARWRLEALGHPAARRALAALERLVPPDPTIVAHLRALAPDVVVLSPVNMRYSEEIEYQKAARKLGLPTAVNVLSWDNVTTKGLFHLPPDRLLCWSPTQRDEAVEVHGVDRQRIRVIGSPFFDKWFGYEQLWPYARLAERVGLDPERPFVLYLGSSANIARDEIWQVEALYGALRSAADPALRSLQILVRPHPANVRNYQRVRLPGVAVWPKEGALPDTAESMVEMYNSLRHATAAVGINTSGMIDALILEAPLFSILSARYLNTQKDAVHFRHILDAGALYPATSVYGCAEGIGRVLAGHDPAAERRASFVREFVRQDTAVSAGEVAAREIEAMGLSQGRARRVP